MKGCFFLRVEAGSRPGGRGTFLCFAKEKYPKERRPNCLRPLRGNLRRCVCGVRRGTRYALRAALGQPRRVSSRSMRVLRHACHPANTPPQAQPDGGCNTGRCFARPGADEALCARPWGPSAATARDHPVEAGPRSAGFGGSGIALFERSEFSETPPNSSTAGCPERSAGTQTAGRLSFGYFSLAKQRRSTSPAGARPGLRPHRRARQ